MSNFWFFSDSFFSPTANFWTIFSAACTCTWIQSLKVPSKWAILLCSVSHRSVSLTATAWRAHNQCILCGPARSHKHLAAHTRDSFSLQCCQQHIRQQADGSIAPHAPTRYSWTGTTWQLVFTSSNLARKLITWKISQNSFSHKGVDKTIY